jgi:hypothetical protein
MNNTKSIRFIGLKSLEADILKNESLSRHVTKFIKQVSNLLDSFALLNDENGSDDTQFRQVLATARTINIPEIDACSIIRRPDNMNNLTLVSEYSEDRSEVQERTRLFSPHKDIYIKKQSFEELKESSKKIVFTENSKSKVKINTKNSNTSVHMSDDKARTTNIFVVKPNKPVTKESNHAIDKVKTKTTFNKAAGLMSKKYEPTVLKKDGHTPVLTSLSSKPVAISTKRADSLRKQVDRIPTKNTSNLLLTKPPIAFKSDKDIFTQDCVDSDKVSEEWISSPMNNIPVRSSKMISDKNILRNRYRSLPKYMNLK